MSYSRRIWAVNVGQPKFYIFRFTSGRTSGRQVLRILPFLWLNDLSLYYVPFYLSDKSLLTVIKHFIKLYAKTQ